MTSTLAIRWSEHEARKPYARPFGVSFGGGGSVAVSGADLLYYRQFQAAVLALTGELFVAPAGDAVDPQRAWLDALAQLLPAVSTFAGRPVSSFDDKAGRLFHVDVRAGQLAPCRLEAPALLEYQEFQAALAHQTGALYRDADVEAQQDAAPRQAAWTAVLRRCLQRPDPAEAMSEEWPWR